MSESRPPADPSASQDVPAGTPPNQPPPYQDWRQLRQAERDARHAAKAEWRAQRRSMHGTWGYGWAGGAILILLGVIFLLQNLGALYFNNWWALFILIPAIAAFGAAWNMYHLSGHFHSGVRGSIITGGVLVLVTATFLFNLNWAIVFPVLLILGGAALLVNALLPS